MGKNRYKFFDDIFNKDLNKWQKGMMIDEIMEMFKTDKDILYTIPIEHSYRPDLIANKFFNNSKLFWILVYVNEINDSPEGFYTGRIIRVPRYERIMENI